MAADYQKTFRRYGRFYKGARKYMQRKEVLVSTNVMLTLFAISFFAVFAIRPTALTISRLWREIKDKKTVQAVLEEKIGDLLEAQSVLVSLENDLVLLDHAIPPTVEFSRLVRLVEYLASTHGLQMPSNRFNDIELYVSEETATASAAQIETHSFTLALKGSFSEIRSFVADLERLDRLISITSVSVQPSRKQVREGVFILELGLDAEAYSFPGGSQLDQQ